MLSASRRPHFQGLMFAARGINSLLTGFNFHQGISMSKRILLASALMFGVLSLPAFAADDPVVARINGSEVHRSDVMREIDMLGPQAAQVPPQMLYPRVLQQMIATRLVSSQGYAQKLQN